METKLYIRDGKRFKYVPNMLGMYWNGIILTKEKMQDSIAVVIEQHYDHVVMASLTVGENEIEDWHDAKIWCENSFNGKGRFPSNTELINLRKYISNDIGSYVWGEEFSTMFAWYLYWYDGSTYTGNKEYGRSIRAIAVTDVPILNLI
jgi:hypothetical protein